MVRRWLLLPLSLALGLITAAGASAQSGVHDREPDDRDYWAGLVPDGVTLVRFGRSTVVPVEENPFIAEGRFTNLFEQFVLLREPIAHINR
jgi:hypothetical protein